MPELIIARNVDGDDGVEVSALTPVRLIWRRSERVSVKSFTIVSSVADSIIKPAAESISTHSPRLI